MRITLIAFLTFTATLSALAQTQPQSQTFDFKTKPTAQGLQEIATVLRTVGDIRNLSINQDAQTVTVSGTADELAMSGWILHNLDQPADLSKPYVVPGKSDDFIRVFHLAHAGVSGQAIQELLTVVRTVGDIQRIFNYTAQSDLVIRGRDADLALAAFMIDALDKPTDAKRESLTMSPEYHYNWAKGTDTVRVYYLAHNDSPRDIQEVLTNLRTVIDVQRVFNFTLGRAIVIRATPETIAAAEWMIRALDLPADAKTQTQEFTLITPWPGGTAIRAFYPANLKDRDLQSTLAQLRTDLQIHKVFVKTTPATVMVRGSADQVTKADQLIQRADKAAKP